MSNLFNSIRPGDRVTIVNRFGQEHSGRCVMVFPAHAVLNMGGRHGIPAIATADNVTRVRKAKSATYL